jgi:4-carboxymuconolactone decarboxylase
MGKYEDMKEKARTVLPPRKPLPGHRNPLDAVAELAPEFGEMTRVTLLGGIYARPQLDMKTRALCTVAALTVLGKEPLLRRWVDTALVLGCTRQEIIEVMTQMGYYGGVPCAVIGLNAAKDVFEARGAQA